MKRSWLKLIEATPRTNLFYFAVLMQLMASAISGAGFVLNNGVCFIIGTVVWIGWFVLIFLVLLPGTDGRLERHLGLLQKGSITIFSVLLTLAIVEVIMFTAFFPIYLKQAPPQAPFTQLMVGLDHVFQYNDGTALAHQAAENLLAGKNPYSNANIVRALLQFGVPYDRVTPLREGSLRDVFPYPSGEQLKNIWNGAIQDPSRPVPELESRVCYPAGSFLLPAPFFAAGITDIRLVYFLFVIAGLMYAVFVIPPRKRLVFIGAAIISLELWNSIAGGETGSLVFPLLLIAWLSLDRNLWVSAVCMALAVATKQTAWFFLPFYLILVFRHHGMKKAAYDALIIAGIFGLLNLPFLLMDPGLWFRSVASPVLDPMFPVGGGLVTLVTGGILDIRSASVFTAMELAVWLAGIVWYIAYCRKYPQTGPILAIMPLFFGWRSLWSYFFYAALISLAYIMANENSMLDKSVNIREKPLPNP